MLRNGQERRRVLAFGCEAANAMSEYPQNAARLPLLQRRVSLRAR
jgi:hypothetical protein